MDIANLLGTIGAAMMLSAYLLNMSDKFDNDNLLYLFLNIIGGALAGYSSYLVDFYPLLVLEGMWSIFSLGSLLKNWLILKKYSRQHSLD